MRKIVHLGPRTRRRAWLRLLGVIVIVTAAVGAGELVAGSGGGAQDAAAPAERQRAVTPDREPPGVSEGAAGPINPRFPGITTFRGNLTRSYYGEGPVPRRPRILWRYPRSGGMCAPSTDESGTQTWCGVGWTGQPNVIPHANGRLELRFGAYDTNYHFLDARTGRQLRPDLDTGDLAKGSATSDPDGYPLYYAGSRDNVFRVVALDRRRPTVLWSLDANASVPYTVWNNDWDGAALVVGDYLLEGGENSWFHVIKLNRGWTRKGKVRVRPRLVLTVPSWDDRLERDAPGQHFSIESSVAFHDGVAYFANSAGLVQGWDVSRVLRGGRKARRVFRFWTGDDTDASVVIDDDGFLYVASELESWNQRSRRVGQLMKLDPRRPKRPLVWSVPLRETGDDGSAGSWSTPALHGENVYVATNAGGVLAVDRDTGRVRWRIRLPGPTWSSPVVVDDVLLQGDCDGVLHAYDVSEPARRPRELWDVELGGCIEATPAVWKGMIFVGTRAGAMYAIGDRRRP
ncbi:MAG: PQQ-binding-like beta-propeller repeat protein [Thermoleophilaceae bacterium]|nr:PQQ-binding-like beta-propeller repeat protein [Thermoleophilaceae bacterium]